jgi:hypothetical protein
MTTPSDPSNDTRPCPPHTHGEAFVLTNGQSYICFRPNGKRDNGIDGTGVELNGHTIGAGRARALWAELRREGWSVVESSQS